MGSKRNKASKGDDGAAEKSKEMITDLRFSKAHTDPRFRRLPRRESKVTIDSRFQAALTAEASAPVDKRGKRRRRGTAKDSLKEYYRIEQDDTKKKKQQRKEDSEDDKSGSDGEQELMALKAEASRRKPEQSSEEEESKSDLKLASSDEESGESAESEEEYSEDVSEEDTDEDDEAFYVDDEPEPEEEIASIEKETHRLAIVNMDWRYVSAKDLYVVFNSFLPKDGRLLSVAVYPSEFGLERIKEEEIHGPAIGGDNKNEDKHDVDEDEEEEDEDVINERLRDYEKSRLKYYFAVAECDSSATADHLYKSCDGIEFERSSNKLDLRFIPDSMEFKHPPRDIANETPATYQGLDFQSQALQMSKVNVSWDEDEPDRVKTLNQKFNPDQLADLVLKEYLASDESESESDEDDNKEKRKEAYRALTEFGDADSDKDEDEENNQDMEVEFNTGLEDLSKKILEKKEKKTETLWEAKLREGREKKRARKMQKKDDDSSSDEDDHDDYNIDDQKKKKKKKKMVNKKDIEERLAAEERSKAELELIVAAENGGDGKGLKGYNIKGKGKKKSKEMAEEKIPSADPDDSRFSAAFTDPNYALDPTNPQFKRSATYVKQLNEKQKEDPRRQEQEKDVETKKESTRDGMVGSSKKRSFAESATVKSLKLKMQQKGSEKKKEGTAELAQRVKKKAKALSNQ